MAVGRKTGGRQPGSPNKLTKQLKEMILQALDESHPDGGIGYLKQSAIDHPQAFLTLVGKVLPLQVNGDIKSSITIVANALDERI